jgi:hypothetical protein
VRAAFFVLVFANVAFLAWSQWIDAPAPGPAAAPTQNLPKLELASDARQAGSSPASPAVSTVGATATRTAYNTVDSQRCVSIGPFSDLTRSARAASVLRERGFDPAQRAEEGEAWEGYWVYVGGLATPEDEGRVLRNLERAGISDAHIMPPRSEGRRISVGLFSERAGADRRARAVKKLGLEPEITERTQAGTVYWIDLHLGNSERAVPTDGLLASEERNSRIEVRICPAPRPAAPTPAVTPRSRPRNDLPPTTTADVRGPLPG